MKKRDNWYTLFVGIRNNTNTSIIMVIIWMPTTELIDLDIKKYAAAISITLRELTRRKSRRLRETAIKYKATIATPPNQLLRKNGKSKLVNFVKNMFATLLLSYSSKKNCQCCK